MCDHATWEIRRQVVGGGAVQIVRQCSACGQRLGGAISRARASAELAGRPLLDFDFGLEADGDARRDAERNAEWDARRARYHQYLASERWADIRVRVLIRARGICEGCARSPAHDVHHLAYAHIYEEFLFELVALCRPCHERWHKDDARP